MMDNFRCLDITMLHFVIVLALYASELSASSEPPFKGIGGMGLWAEQLIHSLRLGHSSWAKVLASLDSPILARIHQKFISGSQCVASVLEVLEEYLHLIRWSDKQYFSFEYLYWVARHHYNISVSVLELSMLRSSWPPCTNFSFRITRVELQASTWYLNFSF